MKNLINKSYQVELDRGNIKANTQRGEFINKLDEELNEIKEAYYKSLPQKHYALELGDLANVCINQLTHLGYDFTEILEEVVNKNKKRIN